MSDVKTILQESGYRIPPYRVARMSDTAAKIVKLLTCDAVCGYRYDEARMILDIVSKTLEKGATECN